MTPGLVDYLKYWLNIFKHAAQIWLDSNAFANAGSLAFFTLFSIAPVIILVVSVIGIFYGQEAAQGQIALQLQDTIGAEAAETVQQAVSSSSLKEGGLIATIVGILAMLVGATTVFGQMQNSLNTIWTVAPKPSRNSILLFIRKRFTSLTIVLAVGFIMLVSLSLSVGLRVFLPHVQATDGSSFYIWTLPDRAVPLQYCNRLHLWCCGLSGIAVTLGKLLIPDTALRRSVHQGPFAGQGQAGSATECSRAIPPRDY